MKNTFLMLTLLVAFHILMPIHAGTIPDVNLANAVRAALGLGSDDTIPPEKLAALEQLHGYNSNIKDLTGLEKATGLIILQLRKNQVSLICSFIYLVDYS